MADRVGILQLVGCNAGGTVGRDLHESLLAALELGGQPDNAVRIHRQVVTVVQHGISRPDGALVVREIDVAVGSEVGVQHRLGGVGHVEAVQCIVSIVGHDVAVVLVTDLGDLNTVDADLNAVRIAGLIAELVHGTFPQLLKLLGLIVDVRDAQGDQVEVGGEGEAAVDIASVVRRDALDVGEGTLRNARILLGVKAVVHVGDGAGCEIIQGAAAEIGAVEVPHQSVLAVRRDAEASHVDRADLALLVVQLADFLPAAVIVLITLCQRGVKALALLIHECLQFNF